MKKETIKNIFWGVLLVIVLLVASHYDYKCNVQEKEVKEVANEADAEQSFYDYHTID